MDKMESLSPEGTDGYTKPVVLLSYLTLKKKSVIAFNKWNYTVPTYFYFM